MDNARPSSSHDGTRQPSEERADTALTQEQEWALAYQARRAAILRDAGVSRVSWQHAVRTGLARANTGDIEGLDAAYRSTTEFHRYLDRQIARLHQTVVPAQLSGPHRDLIDDVGRLRRVVLSFEHSLRPGFFRLYGRPDEHRLKQAERMLADMLGGQPQPAGEPLDNQPDGDTGGDSSPQD